MPDDVDSTDEILINDNVFSCDNVGFSVLKYLSRQGDVNKEDVFKWLRTPPELTVVRVNTNKSTRCKVRNSLTSLFGESADRYNIKEVEGTEEVLSVKSKSAFKSKVNVLESEVIVDEMCGLAVLRGANVFAPGILSISPGTVPNSHVSVYADLERKCLRGFAKQYTGRKVHVGNGRLIVSREDVFRDNVGGNGVVMDDRIFECPSIDERLLEGEAMLQNLPSVVAVLELDPQPGHRVLDMCSAPGGKTMHIAARMKDTGTVIALDKSAAKVKQVLRNCDLHSFQNVHAYAFDSRKSVKKSDDPDCLVQEKIDLTSLPPPYPCGQFDKVLLDAPCSALGQRPQFRNKIRMKELESFPRVQRKLFQAAVDHLVPGGTLIYSTCTINYEENEGMVEWALQQEFSSSLKPVPVTNWITDKSLLNKPNNLNLDVNSHTFGHPHHKDIHDTIGFFVAKYIKT